MAMRWWINMSEAKLIKAPPRPQTPNPIRPSNLPFVVACYRIMFPLDFPRRKHRGAG
jgi:hypothetical protein